MNDSLLIKAAQRASRDAMLMASLIDQCGNRENLSWSQIAAHLQLDDMQLARLALCRCPREEQFQADVAQIAGHVGVDGRMLTEFVQQFERPSVPSVGPVAGGSKESRAVHGGSMVAGAARKRGSTMLRSRVWIAGAVAVGLVLLVVFAFAQPERPEATLIVTEGQATVVQAKGGARAILAGTRTEVSVGEAIVVSTGASIAVSDGSAAQLRLLDGSTVDLYEGTTVDVAELVTTSDSYRVRLDMSSGKTISRVRRLLGIGDEFQISTPSSSASVRGTIFTVEVIDPLTTYFACDEGVVLVRMGRREADVRAGEELLAVAREALTVKPQEEEAVSVALEPGDPEDTTAPAAEDGTGAPMDGPAVPDSGLPGDASAPPSGDTAASGPPTGEASAPPSGDASTMPSEDGSAAPSGDTSAPSSGDAPAAPPTNTPVPLATDTSVPPPTDTPTPVPTNTPVPSPTEVVFSCSDLTISHVNQAKWRIRNNSSVPITLTNIALNWPASNGDLQAITLEAKTIWSGSAAPTSVNIALSGSLSDRQISAGQQRMLDFTFASGAAGTGYNINATFDVGCSLSSVD